MFFYSANKETLVSLYLFGITLLFTLGSCRAKPTPPEPVDPNADLVSGDFNQKKTPLISHPKSTEDQNNTKPTTPLSPIPLLHLPDDTSPITTTTPKPDDTTELKQYTQVFYEKTLKDQPKEFSTTGPAPHALQWNLVQYTNGLRKWNEEIRKENTDSNRLKTFQWESVLGYFNQIPDNEGLRNPKILVRGPKKTSDHFKFQDNDFILSTAWNLTLWHLDHYLQFLDVLQQLHKDIQAGTVGPNHFLHSLQHAMQIQNFLTIITPDNANSGTNTHPTLPLTFPAITFQPHNIKTTDTSLVFNLKKGKNNNWRIESQQANQQYLANLFGKLHNRMVLPNAALLKKHILLFIDLLVSIIRDETASQSPHFTTLFKDQPTDIAILNTPSQNHINIISQVRAKLDDDTLANVWLPSPATP